MLIIFMLVVNFSVAEYARLVVDCYVFKYLDRLPKQKIFENPHVGRLHGSWFRYGCLNYYVRHPQEISLSQKLRSFSITQ